MTGSGEREGSALSGAEQALVRVGVGGSATDLASVVADLLRRQCPTATIELLLWGSGDATDQGSGSAATEAAEALICAVGGPGQAEIDDGFVIRIGPPEAPVGAVVVRGVPRGEVRDGCLGWLHETAGVLELALVSVRAREEARAERARAQVTMESLFDPHVLLLPVRDDDGNIVDFVYLDANPAACAHNRRSRTDLVGTRLLDLLPGHAASGILAAYAAVVDTGVPYICDGLTYLNEISGEVRRSDVRGIRVAEGLSLTWRDVTERYEVAEALSESEERYRLLAENSSDVVYLAGPDRRIRWIAPSVVGTLGWSPEELVGTEAIDLVHPRDRVQINASREAAYTGSADPRAKRDPMLLRVRRKDGRYLWIVGFNSPLHDASGNLTGVAGSMRDVDDLVIAREEAQVERARLRATVQSLLDPHVFLEAVRDETDRIIDFVYADANQAACAYMRLTPDRLIGSTLLQLLPGQASTGMLDLYASAVDTGRPLILDDYAYPHEIREEERRFDIRAIRVADGLSFTWRDVTDRFVAARALAESESRYRILADNASDVVGHLRDGVFVWVSSSVEGELGWRPDEVVGRRSQDFIDAADHARLLAGQGRVGGGRPNRQRYRFRAKDGTVHWIDSQSAPYVDEHGAWDGMVVSMRIVDAEVRAQQALEVRARQDQVTGLANREEAFEQLDGLLGRTMRTGRRTAVVFCDFDNFKIVNDTCGHSAGDRVLRVVGERLRATVRSGDLVARIGGDELLVVLDGVRDLADAVDIAEKMRSVSILPIDIGVATVSVTLSFGVTLAAPDEGIDALIARADAAMYRAKESGRDQVVAIAPRDDEVVAATPDR